MNGVDLGGQYGFSWIKNLGAYLSYAIIPVVFEIASIALLFYFVIAAFKLVTSGGDKEAVAGARAMITHAIIGLVMLIAVFLLLQYLPPAIGLKGLVIVQ